MTNPNTYSGIRKYVWRYVDQDVAYPDTLLAKVENKCN